MHWLWAIIIGFLAGAIAKWFVPGPHGFIVTTLLGIVGAIVATWLGQHIGQAGSRCRVYRRHCRRRDHFGGLSGVLRRANLTAPASTGNRLCLSFTHAFASPWRHKSAETKASLLHFRSGCYAGTRRQSSASADQASDMWRARNRLGDVTTSGVAPHATHSRAISKVSGKCARTWSRSWRTAATVRRSRCQLSTNRRRSSLVRQSTEANGSSSRISSAS